MIIPLYWQGRHFCIRCWRMGNTAALSGSRCFAGTFCWRTSWVFMKALFMKTNCLHLKQCCLRKGFRILVGYCITEGSGKVLLWPVHHLFNRFMGILYVCGKRISSYWKKSAAWKRGICCMVYWIRFLCMPVGSLIACHGRNVEKSIIFRKKKDFCFGFSLQRI